MYDLPDSGQLIVLTISQFEDAKNALDAGKHVLLEKVRIYS